MTDSAGTPADPHHPDGDEPHEGSQDKGGAASQNDSPTTGSPAKDSPTADSSAKDSPTADSSAEDTAPEPGETAAGSDSHAGQNADTPDKAAQDEATAAGDGSQGGEDAVGGVQTWADRPKGGPPSEGPKRHWLRWTALGASFIVLVAAGTGWWLYKKLDSNITTDTGAAAELKAYERERPTPIAQDAQNILLIGSDSRSGDNRKYGRDDGGSQRSDTTILLHLAADRRSATAVSIPRDLMVKIPSCHKADGKAVKKQFAQFNWAFEVGGTACTIRTIERMTGVRIDHHMVIDFNGFKDMVDAVDGVEVCLEKPVDDDDAHLELPAGRQKLDGEQALGYVRARKSIGDGSDTERMDRQQRFLGALVNKMQSNGVLLNPTRLYPVLDAATKSLTTDPGLDSLRDLYDLVRGMRNVPTEKVQFLTVPRQPYRANPNRDELVQPDADRLFKQLREDAPVAVVPSDEMKPTDSQGTHSPEEEPSGSNTGDTDSSPTPAPTYSGSNAAADVCKR